MSTDTLFHVLDIIIQGAIAAAVVPAAWRVSQVLKYFPPHRHVNGRVEYAPGYEPGRTESLKMTPNS